MSSYGTKVAHVGDSDAFLTALPLDCCSSVIEFLDLSDLPSLFSTCRRIRKFFDQENTFERLARIRFPAETLIVSSYNGSWKRLMQDDNAENGVYVRRMCVVSEWRYNRQYESLHYINAVRCMVWDKHARQVYIGIEGFGSHDLRPAATTSIFQLRGGAIQPRHLGQRSANPRPPPLPVIERRIPTRNPGSISRSRSGIMLSTTHNSGHDISLVAIDDRWFQEPGCQYQFCYNGSIDSSGSDYECKLFLRNCSSLRQCFRLGYSPLIEGFNHCEFVSRDTIFLAPSNVLEWPKLIISDDHEEIELQHEMDRILPEVFRKNHARGSWGTISPETNRVYSANNLRGH